MLGSFTNKEGDSPGYVTNDHYKSTNLPTTSAALRVLRGGNVHTPIPNYIPHDPNLSEKGRIYAAQVILINDLWSKIAKFITINHDTLGLSDLLNDNQLLPCPLEKLEQELASVESRIELKKIVMSKQVNTALYFINDWLSERERNRLQLGSQTGELSESSLLQKAYNEAYELVHKMQVRLPFTSPSTQLKSGFGAGLNFIWNTLAVVPEVYKRQYGELPSAEQIENSIPSCFNFIDKSAFTPADRFNSYIEFLSINSSRGSFFNPERFTLVNQKSGLSLDLLIPEEGSVTQLPPIKDLPIYGCPALIAHGEKAHVIRELSIWTSKIMNRLYFPRINIAT